MRLGYFTDTHARTDSPEGRTDDYRLSVYNKLEEVGHIFNEQKVDKALFGGDLFDHPDVAQSLIYDVMGILKKWELPILGTIGSHDYFGYQIKTLKRTAMGILRQSGVLEIIDSEESELKFEDGRQYLPSRVRFTEGDFNVDIVATPHTYWLAEDPMNYHKERESDTNCQIQLTHGDLQHKNVPWPHVLINDITTTSDIVLGAHYHPGWPEVKRIIDGREVWFFHPGAIARMENTGVTRIPRVLILDITKDNLSFEYIPLTTMEKHPFKYKEVNDEEAPTLQDIGKLMHLIENTKITSIDIKEQLPLMATELEYSKEVLHKAFEYLDATKNKK